MPSIDKLRHNIRHAVSLSAFSPNLIHRIRYFFLCTVTFRDYSPCPSFILATILFTATRRMTLITVLNKPTAVEKL